MIKLFYENPYMKEFETTVIKCEKIKDYYGVQLAETAFYPEGGGQPFDVGFINGAAVTEVHEKNGEILHYTSEPISEGSHVICAIDWQRRFSFMQEHSGEHILSGLIKSLYDLNNVGFHMGSDYVTIDINGILSSEQIAEAERLANEAIYLNIDVESDFFTANQLENTVYRFKKELEGPIRIVKIGEYDTCACCGIHCGKTGEIGIIKIIGYQNYKNGMRLFLLCGQKAFRDYSEKNKNTNDISTMLSSKQNEVTEAVGGLLNENARLKQTIVSLRNKITANAAERVEESTESICIVDDNLLPDDLRRLSVMISERRPVVLTLSGADNLYKYALSSKERDMRELAKKLNEKFDGRGGGKAQLTQGSLTGELQEIIDFFKSIS